MESHSKFRVSVYMFAMLSILFASAAPALAERFAVKTKVANIRSGPDTKYDIIWKIEKYHPLKVIRKSGNWYHFVDYEGDKGWIHKSLLFKTKTVVTIKDACNIRSGPGMEHKVLFTSDRGVGYRLIKKEGKWLNIQHADGDIGWIYKTLVW